MGKATEENRPLPRVIKTNCSTCVPETYDKAAPYIHDEEMMVNERGIIVPKADD